MFHMDSLKSFTKLAPLKQITRFRNWRYKVRKSPRPPTVKNLGLEKAGGMMVIRDCSPRNINSLK